MRSAALCVLCALCACHLDPLPTDPGAGCEQAAARIVELQCPGWQGSPGVDDVFGTGDADELPLVDVCRVTEREGADWKTECVAAALDCAGVEACFQ